MNLLQKIESEIGIYIHYPWCLVKCSYCDFFSVPSAKLSPENFLKENQEFLNTLLEEIRLRANLFGNKNVSSIYFGGGTSSLMKPEWIDSILCEIKKHFSLSDCEITLEGNPENITEDYLRSLSQAGINRVNAGFQSFSEKNLRLLQRFHNQDKYLSALEALSRSPISNWGGDLIYGIPGQDEDDFYGDLNALLSYNPRHLSLYSLTVEENTALLSCVQKKEIQEPDEDLQQKILLNLNEHLRPAGFRQYEISNFAKEGYECIHNLRYWLYGAYLGAGPGAHGFTGKKRYGNPRNIKSWKENLLGAEIFSEDAAEEIPLTVLRLTVPVSVNYLTALLENHIEKFSREAHGKIIQDLIRKWTESGYAKYSGKEEFSLFGDDCGESFIWTKEGLKYLDSRILEFSQRLEAL